MTTVKYHDETKKNVCQSDLIRETAINLAISQVTAEKVIKEYIKVLQNHILVDDRTTIIGLGVFYQAFDRRKANLKSAAKTLPYKSMRFKPSRMLNKQIMFLANNMNKQPDFLQYKSHIAISYRSMAFVFALVWVDY